MSICDFCSSPEVRWDYPARNFSLHSKLQAMEYNSAEGWAACDSCHRLIQAGDREGLARRSAETHADSRTVPVRVLVPIIRELQDEFWANRLGGPVPAPPGDPTHTS